jgi:hypothetical protein
MTWFDALPVCLGHGTAGKQPGMPLADQRRRVGHGAHDALAAQPAGDAVAADASGHAQVQRLLVQKTVCSRDCRILEGLRLDSPDYQAEALAQRPGLGLQGLYAETAPAACRGRRL